MLWDLLSLNILFKLLEPSTVTVNRNYEISSIIISNCVDHPIILASSWDELIRIWDSVTGKEFSILYIYIYISYNE
jgi:WD40 repeat protein